MGNISLKLKNLKMIHWNLDWFDGMDFQLINKNLDNIKYKITKGSYLDVQVHQTAEKCDTLKINTKGILYKKETFFIWLENGKIIYSNNIPITNNNNILILWEINITIRSESIIDITYVDLRGLHINCYISQKALRKRKIIEIEKNKT
jgi:hypothetical protein